MRKGGLAVVSQGEPFYMMFLKSRAHYYFNRKVILGKQKQNASLGGNTKHCYQQKLYCSRVSHLAGNLRQQLLGDILEKE